MRDMAGFWVVTFDAAFYLGRRKWEGVLSSRTLMVLPNTKVLARMQDEIWSHALCRFTCRQRGRSMSHVSSDSHSKAVQRHSP